MARSEVFLLLFPTVLSAAAQAPDWQQRCESRPPALVARSGHAPSPLPAPLWSIDVDGIPRDLVSADFDGPLVALLDKSRARVSWYDPTGKVVRTAGRSGEGPGDLRFGPVIVGSRQKLAMFRGGFAVADDQRITTFDSVGNYLSGVVPSSGPASMAADVQVAVTAESRVMFSTSGRWFPNLPFDQRTRVTIFRRSIDRTGNPSFTPLASLRNSLAIFDSFAGFMPRRPYRTLYNRTWGAGGEYLYAVAYTYFGICRFTLATGAVSYLTVAAAPREVDDREKDRELKTLFGDPDWRDANLRMTPREYLKDRWPRHAPFYHDLLVSPDGTALAVRLGGDGNVVADLYRPTGQYASSYIIPPKLTLHRLRGDTLLALDGDVGALVAFRIR